MCFHEHKDIVCLKFYFFVKCCFVHTIVFGFKLYGVGLWMTDLPSANSNTAVQGGQCQIGTVFQYTLSSEPHKNCLPYFFGGVFCSGKLYYFDGRGDIVHILCDMY